MNPLELFTDRTATLRSPLAPDAVAERLSAITDGFFTFFGSKPLIGSVTPRSAWVRRRINYRNSFQIVLSAQFEPAGSGTTIRCRFGPMALVRVFMIVWFSAVLLIGAGFGYSALTGKLGPDIPLLLGLFPLGFLFFGILLAGVGRWAARNDESFLVQTLCAAADATVAEREPGYTELTADEMARMAKPGMTPWIIMLIAFIVLMVGVAGAMIYFATGAP